MTKRRKLTPTEKLANKAAKRNHQTRAEIPLFAEQLPQHTALTEFWRSRWNLARCTIHLNEVVGPVATAARWFDVWCRECEAKKVLTEAAFAEGKAKVEGLKADGRSPEYALDAWYQVMAREVPGYREAKVAAAGKRYVAYQPNDGGVEKLVDEVIKRSRAVRGA